jgi:hypothetical protein
MVRHTLSGISLALALLACGSDAGEPDESLVQGVWAGSITGDAQEGLLRWELEDSGGEISGEGVLSTAAASVALTIDGSYSAPNLQLTMHPEGFEAITFAGTVGASTIKGRMTGAGLINRSVILDRQP